MKHYISCFAFFAVAATGCNKPQNDSAIAELRESNIELSTKLETANKRIKETEDELVSLQAEMKLFKQGFDAQKRQQLVENIEVVEKLLTEIRLQANSANDSLQQAQDLKSEIERLKDLCLKHESEASDANQIGKVKAAVHSISQSIDKLERKIGPIPSLPIKFRQLDSKVRQLESKVRRLR